VRYLLLAFVIFLGADAVASAPPLFSKEPFVPTQDNMVLERLPYVTDPAARQLRLWREQRARNPSDPALAVRLARKYIEQGRAELDPRYYGYAQATLAPWWDMPEPAADILVLRAIIHQSNHNFDRALADLSLALKADPRHAQAWITRAMILQTQGEYAEAKRHCMPLLRLSTPLYATTCMASVASFNGKAQQSYDLLRRSMDNSLNSTGRLWALTVLADISIRTGQGRLAEAHLKEAFLLAPRDRYLLGLYADFLMNEGRHAEVIPLLENEVQIDGLLLRLALAKQAIGAPDLAARVEALRERFAASRLRTDVRHRREEATSALYLLNKPHEALELARANWVTQKEPEDARIFLASALAANDPAAARPVLHWLTVTQLEDVRLIPFANKIKAL